MPFPAVKNIELRPRNQSSNLFSHALLGHSYLGVERILVSLLQFMRNRAAADLDQDLFDEWSRSFATLSANVRRNRQREVRNLCLYRQRTEPDCFVPDANRFPRPRPSVDGSPARSSRHGRRDGPDPPAGRYRCGCRPSAPRPPSHTFPHRSREAMSSRSLPPVSSRLTSAQAQPKAAQTMQVRRWGASRA